MYILQGLPDLAALTHKKDIEDYRQTCTTLVSVCQASRAFRAFTQPLLYRAYIEEEDEQGYNRLKRSEGEDYTRLELFLRILIHRPDLAAKVEFLRLSDCLDPENIKEYCPLSDLFIRASRKICVFYKSLPFEKARLHRDFVWQSDWQHGLRRRGISPDADVALLLALFFQEQPLTTFVCRSNLPCGLCFATGTS